MINEYLQNSEMEGMGRCGDMAWISFGKRINVIKTIGTENIIRNLSEYELHLQCPFRITKGTEILISNYDIYVVPEDSVNEEWDVYGNNKYDRFIKETLLPMLPLKVKKVNCMDIGDIEIFLDNNMVISIFVNSSELEEEWRFINHKTDEHLVFREVDYSDEDDD